MEQLLEKLKQLLPNVTFEPGDTSFWSPESSRVTYSSGSGHQTRQSWALLHEASHALLGHSSYWTDLELLQLEVAAWEAAKELGRQYDVVIDEEHVQDCLDTYRDWLHQRSTCPLCVNVGLQHSTREYHCFNCQTVWQVSPSRFCRPYRQLNRGKNKTPHLAENQRTFS